MFTKLSAAIAIAFAAILGGSAAFAQTATYRLCTGDPKLTYFAVGHIIKKHANRAVNVVVVESNGTVDNLNKVLAGECDGLVGQNDAAKIFSEQNPRVISALERTATLYREHLHFLCNAKAGVKTIDDLPKNTVVAIGDQGSGSSMTFAAIRGKLGDKMKTVQVDNRSGLRAVAAVADGTDVQCFLGVAGLNSALYKNDSKPFAGKVVFVPISESVVSGLLDIKKRPLYTETQIDGNVYPHLSPSGALWGKKAVSTLSVEAVLFTSTEWIEKNKRPYDAIISAAGASIPEIELRVNPAN